YEISEVASLARSGCSSDSVGSGRGISTAASNDVEDAVDVLANLVKSVTVDRDSLSDFDYLKSTFYQVDSTTNVTPELLDVSEFLTRDMTLVKSVDGSPQILIYHTHSQEGYADSVEGDSSTTVVGVGEYLTSLLTEQYGYFVLHHMGEYDVGDRDHAYTNAAPALEELLEEYPSIQVVIDLHRDGVSDSTHLVTEINGKPTAQIMFFNGISHTTALGDISWLPNEYIEGNLAFSFRLQLAAAEYYPGLTRKIYIKGYRYNMHYLPQSLLVEVGAQNNTIEEAMNAMEPLAAILDYVLSGGT
ncbi:MAG: stage II sporulation protein P, partial [Clostridiales bacterium]|nr:stage II sporulation protein P [Clostridiales bacterium]